MRVGLHLCGLLAVLVGGGPVAAAERPTPKLIGLIAADGSPMLFAAVSAGAWRAAFEQSDLVRKYGLSVALLRTPEALTEALTTRAGEFFAIVNPNGEAFLCGGPDDAKPMLGRIRSYMGQGGIWWETGGWPLCHPFWLKKEGGWEVGGLGGESGATFRLEAKDWRDDAPVVNATVTDAGRAWLGAARADALSREKVATQRASTAECASVVLVRAGNATYLTGHRAGYGWLFRAGGFSPGPALIVPAAVGVCEHLWALAAEVANAAPGSAAKRARPPCMIGIVSPEPANGAPLAISPDDLQEALSETGLVRCAYLQAMPLRTPEALSEALTERAAEYLAIINPLGESFLVGSEADTKPMLARIKSYLEQGGVWWEVGGYPFWYPCWPKSENGKFVEWGHGNFGHDGLATFGVRCEITPDVDPLPLQVTSAGREMLGAEWAELLAQERGDANRAPERQTAAVVLAEVAGRPYVSASCVGKGLLWQVGGMPVGPPVVFPCIMGTCRYLWTHPFPGQ